MTENLVRVLVIAHRVAPFRGDDLSHRIERAPELARSLTLQGTNAFARPQFRSADQAGSPVRDQVIGSSKLLLFRTKTDEHLLRALLNCAISVS